MTYPIDFQAFIELMLSFAQLDAFEIRALIDRTDMIRYKKKQSLLHQGEVCTGLYFITQGCCQVSTTINGKKNILHFSRQYDIVTNIEGILFKAPSPISIQALEETKVIFLSYDTVQWICESVNEGEKLIRTFWEKYTAQEMIKVHFRYESDPMKRYYQLVDSFPDIDQRVSQKKIASYLNITPEYLSRLKAQAK